ncbi:MAG TPA: sugar kinase [Bacillales bacterium]|nr:sugar kinase [Bacillales bacterium]
MDKIVTLGEPMAMFVADQTGPLEEIDHFTKYLAGAEVNVCIGLKRLGHDVTYVTKLGKDPFGKYIQRTLEKEKIDTSYLSFDREYPTGFQLKSKVESGDPDVVYFRKGSAASHINTEDLRKVNLTETRHVHLTGIPLALSESCRQAVYEFVESVKEQGLPLTFDPNLRPNLWKSPEMMVETINRVAGQCDVVLPGIQEAEILTGTRNLTAIGDFYIEKGVKTVIVKLGPEGAFVKTADQEFRVPGFRVDKVVDTVGAGDGFAVGVISGLIEGLPLREAVIRGNAIGALQVMTPGDNDGLPDRSSLERYLETGEGVR